MSNSTTIDTATRTKPVDMDFHVSLGSFLFILIHVGCLLAFWVGVNWTALLMCAITFLVRKFAITGAYHRYFSHRSYKTSRVFQFILAFLGGTAVQKGSLWWAAHHRHHHKYSDTELDIHSAKREGFYWSHIGWVLSKEYVEYEPNNVRDLSKYPELVWLDKYHYIPPLTLLALCCLIYGWMGFVWGFLISTVILYHTTFAINSLCHMFGKQRYKTGESSKNSLWLAIITLGEGWHNNHHKYPLSTRQGFFWWEIDISYYILKLLSFVGLIWDLQAPPKRLLQKEAMDAELETEAKAAA